MPAFQHIPLSIIEPIRPQDLAQGGAAVGQVPAWNGVNYTPQNPVSWFNAGAALGKISEINIVGSGVFSSVTGNRATLTINAGAISVNGQPVTAINPGANMSASVVGGVATLNAVGGSSSISLNQTGVGAAIIVSPGTASAFSLKGLVGANGISVQDFGSYLLLNGAGAGGGYVHPSYTPQTFTPSLVGNVLTLAGFSRDSIGSTDTITPFSFTLPTGGGGIAGISLNGVGSYTNIQFGSGFSVSGNLVNTIGAGHTIGNGALGAGIVSLPGFASSHTLKGLLGGGATTVTDMGSHILISSTGGSGGSNTVEVRKDGVTINPAAFILNFTGAGVSVANGVGVEINIPGGSGSAGVSSFNGATGAISLIAGTNTSITNFGGGLFQINATAGSSSLIGFSANGLSVTSNSVSLAMASLANAGAMPAWSGISTQFLNGNGQWATPSVSGGITGISVNGLGTYTNLQFGSGLSVVGNTITATGVIGGITNVVSSTPSVLSASVSSGTATIATNGFSGTFTPFFNPATKTLSLPNHSLTSGVTTSIGTAFVDLSSILPLGTNGDVLVNNGTAWAASSSLKIFPFSIQSTSQVSFNPGSGGPNTNLFSIDAIFSRLQAMTLRLNDMTASQTIIGRDINSNARGIITVISDGLQRLGFFHTAPVVQPVIIPGDHASTQAALIALGLARY